MSDSFLACRHILSISFTGLSVQSSCKEGDENSLTQFIFSDLALALHKRCFPSQELRDHLLALSSRLQLRIKTKLSNAQFLEPAFFLFPKVTVDIFPFLVALFVFMIPQRLSQRFLNHFCKFSQHPRTQFS